LETQTGADEFSSYAETSWPKLVRSALLLGCSLPDAEDLVQTTLTKVYVKWNSVKSAESRDAYVYRILFNCHAKSRRRRWWGENPVADLPESSISDPSEDVVLRDAIRRALAGLGVDGRAVVVLRLFVELSVRETATALRISEGTVKSRLARSLQMLSNDANLALYREGSRHV
jgi:RNA polymerase sigma-70 factor (sigma-E family)